MSTQEVKIEQPRLKVGGVPFMVSDLHQATRWLLDSAVPARLAVNVRLANAYNVALTREQPTYLDLLRNHGVNFPDGTPIVWCMRLRRRAPHAARPGRVRGPSLFVHALKESEPHAVRHFLLGSSTSTLDRLEGTIRSQYPGVVVAGSYSPPYAPVDDAYIEDCATQIRQTDPDLVWVGLGTPKQDLVGTALASRLGMPTVNVGAAFDFLAGTAREAPHWVQRSGMEWLFRLINEPRRLWRRYVFGNWHFLHVVAEHWKIDRSHQ